MSFQFEHSNSTWVRYSEYEWKQTEDGKLYLTACSNAQPTIYDPLKEYQQLVLDALYIGRLGMKQEQDDEEIQAEIKAFAEKYGLFGLMTALPTTPSFMDYEAVYLPKNRFIKKETMSTEDYLNLFFPFDKLDIVKHSVESLWNIEGDNMRQYDDGARYDNERQTDGGQYELSASVCRELRVDEAGAYRLGVYCHNSVSVLQ